jgi:hypothetical protein
LQVKRKRESFLWLSLRGCDIKRIKNAKRMAKVAGIPQVIFHNSLYGKMLGS